MTISKDHWKAISFLLSFLLIILFSLFGFPTSVQKVIAEQLNTFTCDESQYWASSALKVLVEKYGYRNDLSCMEWSLQEDYPSVRADNAAFLGSALRTIQNSEEEKLSKIEKELREIEDIVQKLNQ